MAKVFTYITINYEKDIYTPSIDMMQGDTGRGLIFNIASPIDGLESELSNLTATLNVVKPTGETQTVTGTIESLGNDMAKITIEPSSDLASAIDVSGLANATLVIANTTQTVTSFNFKIKIKPNPFYPKPTVRKFDVTKVSRITGVQQYEHCVQSIEFVGLEYTGNMYIVLNNDTFVQDSETEGYHNTVPLTNNTFIIGQPMTFYSGVFSCQLLGETTSNGETTKFEISPIFYIEVAESIEQGEETEYPIDPNITFGIDEYIADVKEQAKSEIESTGDAVIASIPSDYSTLSSEVSDIRTGADGRIYESAGNAVRGQIEKVSSKIEPLDLDVTTGGGYNTIVKKYYANSSYKCALIEVDDGDELYFTSTTWGYCPLAVFFSGEPSPDTYLGYQGQQGTTEGVTYSYSDELIVIPLGTKYVGINAYGLSTTMIAKKVVTDYYKKKIEELDQYKPPIYANYLDGKIVVKTKYDADNDIEITLCKRGGNNLIDFDTIKTIDVDGNKTTILTNVSDWFMPYMVRAISNADGDLPDNWYSHFCGGNHQYNNASSGSTPTARCVIGKVLFDKKEVINGDEAQYCNTVEIFWTNYIQGQNTKKADGSGREILKEQYHLTFDGKKFDIEHVFIPLEDVMIIRYFGLGCFYHNANGYKYDYIGGSNRVTQTAPCNSDSGDKNCRKVIISDDKIKITLGINNEDMGDFELNEIMPYSFFSTTDRKVYGCLIYMNTNSKTFAQNSHYYFSGSYQFDKPQ